MAGIAPVVVRGVAGGATGGAAAGGATKTAAANAAGTAGAVKKSAAASVPSGTAAASASRHRAGGSTRAQAVRALQDEYGATAAQAGDLFDAAPSAAAPAAAAPARSGLTVPRAPKSVGAAAQAGGGALLGAIGYVLFLTYMRDGLPGVQAWFRAKFLNQVSS